MSKIFVGIDVAKDLSTGHGLNTKGETLFSISFPMNSAGFSTLLNELKSNSQDLSRVLVAMESTACYHINLFSFLIANGVNAVVINPLLIANFAGLSLRKTETDQKDAGTIAQFAMIHKDSIFQLSVTQDLQDLRDLARESESLCLLTNIHKQNRGKKTPSKTFPGVRNYLRSFNEGNARLSAGVLFCSDSGSR